MSVAIIDELVATRLELSNRILKGAPTNDNEKEELKQVLERFQTLGNLIERHNLSRLDIERAQAALGELKKQNKKLAQASKAIADVSEVLKVADEILKIAVSVVGLAG